jgi:hypothetical protein
VRGREVSMDRDVARPGGFPGRVKRVLVNLAILAVVLVVGYFAGLLWVSPVLIAALVVAICLPLVFPGRYEDLAGAIAWLGLAAFLYLYARAELWALICAVIGVFSLMAAVSSLKARAGAAGRG